MKTNKNKIKRTSLAMSMVLLSAFTLVGCSSEPEYGLSITAIAPSVSQDKAEEYEATLTVGEENLPVQVNTEMMIPSQEEENVDPDAEYNPEDSMDDLNDKSAEMMGAAGMMKITAQISAKEIDIIISDYENGQRLASMGTYMTLDEVFTAEELAEIDESLIVSYEEYDEDNNPTGNMLPASGIDVTAVEEFSEFMAGEQLVCHVVGNTENLEDSKDYLMSLIV